MAALACRANARAIANRTVQVNNNLVRWIIGDIHGMLRPLEALLAAIAREDPAPQLYFVGDYVNRGPDSRGVVELVMRLPNARFIRGNHDDIFDEVLHGVSYADNASQGDALVAFSWFMNHGLASTLLSYGVDDEELDVGQRCPSPKRVENLLAAVPESHRDFIFNLPPVIEEADFFVAHARWHPEDLTASPSIAEQLAIDPSRRHQLLWDRFERDEIGHIKAWDRRGYFGHTAVDCYPSLLGDKGLVPLVGDKIVLLETGIALSADGRLTAFCHETGRFLQTSRAGLIVE